MPGVTEPGEEVDRPSIGRPEQLALARSGKDLKRKSLQSGTVTLGSQLSAITLGTATTAILGRILTPQDFGVVAMVLSVTVLAKLFQDIGLSSAAIQKGNLTHEQSSTLFWINVSLGTFLTLLLSCLGPVLAWFYQQPEVLWVTIALSAKFLISGFSIQQGALLKRSMRFKALGKIQIAQAFVVAVVTVAAAVAGLRYWSLVLGVLAGSVSRSVMLWSTTGWVPGRAKRGVGTRDLVRFGANVTGFELANYFSRNLDNVLIGKVWGADVLGLYSKAYALLMLPISNLRDPLNAVALPALSQLRHHKARYRGYFRRYLSLLAFASMPVVAFLFVCSDNVILILLGPRWIESSGIFSILAVSAFIQPVVASRGLVMITTGNSRRFFWFGIWNALAVSTGFAIGVPWGAKGVALAYVVVNYLTLYPSLLFCYKGTPICVRDFFTSIALAANASIAAAVITFVVKSAVGSGNALVILAICATVFAAAYFLVFTVLPGGKTELKKYVSYLFLLIERRRESEGFKTGS
ncbi:MAG: lipopolysaccharide biosynthesis protein [Pyrinomonadaceae bacterium]|nr:lipopolysaccharide biosynthesis protein [Pyrinomonadaceae bacterium]